MQYAITPSDRSAPVAAKIDQLMYSHRTTTKRTLAIINATVQIKPAVLPVGDVTLRLRAAHSDIAQRNSMRTPPRSSGAPEPKDIGAHAPMQHNRAIDLKGCLNLLRIQEPQPT